MVEVIWSPQSLRDVESIAAFIAEDSEQYASLFIQDVLQSVDRLADFPESGRIVPELNDSSIREIIFGNYRVICRIKRKSIGIVTVRHGARILDSSKLK
jgi:addiction module RelE/StbE family toxin